MIIREATGEDWPQLYPIFRAIVAAGETYAYPEGLSSSQAASMWMEAPPGRTTVAVEGDSVHGDTVHGDTVHGDTVHGDTVHGDTVHGDTVHGDTVHGDTVHGTAKMGPNRDGRGAHVATASFMVEPGSAGRGVGRALGEDMIGWARDAGYRGIQFNAVVETNVAAVHLWQALGFEIVGTVPDAFEHPRHGYVGLHVMYRRL